MPRTRSTQRSTPLVLTPEECREIDRLCAEEYRIPTLLLMECAALQVARAVLETAKRGGTPRVLIVAGSGNNGGDALAAARHLANSGAETAVVLVGDASRLSPEAAVHFGIAKRMRVPVFPARRTVRPAMNAAFRALGRSVPDVVVDGLFGTGLSRPAIGAPAEAIHAVNILGSRGSHVVAIDIPSGLDAANGSPLGCVIRADVTVTFVGLKAGMLTPAARGLLGEVQVADIGVPQIVIEGVIKARGGRITERGTRRARPHARKSSRPS